MSDEQRQERSELKRQVFRGRRARIFIGTETYRDLDEELGARQVKLTDGLREAGARITKVDELALISARVSGQSLEIERLVVLFQQWINDGLEAEKKLKELGVEL